MKREITNRGFIIKTFKDYYNGTVELQESSSAVPQVWLGLVDNGAAGAGEPQLRRMLLDKKLAAELVEELNYFINTGRLR